MAKSNKRLSQIAREFNIGLTTIVEFLDKKGHKVETRPNTKVTPECYALLVSEFSSDKSVKTESRKISKRKTPVKETVSLVEHPPLTPPKEKTPPKEIFKKEEVKGPTVVGKIDLDKPIIKKVEAEIKKEEPTISIEKKKRSQRYLKHHL